jgi:hypothetical protein
VRRKHRTRREFIDHEFDPLRAHKSEPSGDDAPNPIG